MREISTELLFKEKPPRQERSIRRKPTTARNLFGAEIGARATGDVLLPKGVVSGVQLETVLRRLSKAQGLTSTSTTLPIPFRAVATDLVTGKAVVFSEGELAQRHARQHVGAGRDRAGGDRRHAARRRRADRTTCRSTSRARWAPTS